MNLILLGPPAAGKGTQAQWILRDFEVVHVSTGDMLRKAIADGTELGKLAKPLLDAGKLVPDEIVNGIIQEWLRAADPAKGIVFDGFPRTVAQAKALDEMMAAVGRRIDAVLSIPPKPGKKPKFSPASTAGRDKMILSIFPSSIIDTAKATAR